MEHQDPPSDAYLFRALMESTADSVYYKDRQCRLLRVSRNMANDVGFADPSELVGKTDVELFGEAFGQRTRIDTLLRMADSAMYQAKKEGSDRHVLSLVPPARPDP